jgi:hypothetical protein
MDGCWYVVGGGGGIDSRGGRGHLGDEIGHSKCNKKG